MDKKEGILFLVVTTIFLLIFNSLISASIYYEDDLYGISPTNITWTTVQNLNRSDYWDNLDTPSDINTVNRSDYWDNLDTPSDINTADITDDNTFVQIIGDTMTGNLIVNANIIANGDITQTSGMSIIRHILHMGRKENYAGNTGLGQGTGVKNTWLNISNTQDEYAHGAGNFAFSGGVFDGESIWLSPSYADNVVKINPATGEMTNYSHGHVDYAFYGACYDGEAVWFAPFNADYFMKIYPENGTMINYTNQYGDAGFASCVFTGDEVVFIPEESDKIVVVNLSTNSFSNVTNINISEAYGLISFNGGLWDGQYVWMVPYYSPYIVRVNLSSGELANYTHGAGTNAFDGACFDGELIWLAPAGSLTIDGINPTTGEMIKYSYDRELNAPGSTAFTGCAFDGENIWFAPTASKYTAKLNPQTGRITKYYNNAVDGAFRGAIFDGQHVWFSPHDYANVVRIRPPEFGRNSLFTSGNLNVGGSQSTFGSSGNIQVNIKSIDKGAFSTLFLTDASHQWAVRQNNVGSFIIRDIDNSQNPMIIKNNSLDYAIVMDADGVMIKGDSGISGTENYPLQVNNGGIWTDEPASISRAARIVTIGSTASTCTAACAALGADWGCAAMCNWQGATSPPRCDGTYKACDTSATYEICTCYRYSTGTV